MTTKGIINAMAESIPFLMKTNDSPEQTQVLKMCDEDGNYVYLWPDEDGEGNKVISIEHEENIEDKELILEKIGNN